MKKTKGILKTLCVSLLKARRDMLLYRANRGMHYWD